MSAQLDVEHPPRYRLPTGEPLRLGQMPHWRAEALGALVVWRQICEVVRLRYGGGSGRTAAARSRGREIGHLLIDFADAAEAGLLDRYVGAEVRDVYGRRVPAGAAIGALWRSFDRLNTLARPSDYSTHTDRQRQMTAAEGYLCALGLEHRYASTHMADDDVRAAILAYELPERPHLAQIRSIGRARLDLARVVPGEHRHVTEEDEARICEMVLAWGVGV